MTQRSNNLSLVSRRSRVALVGLGALSLALSLAWGLLILESYRRPLSLPESSPSTQAERNSLRITDRNGVLLGEVRDGEGKRAHSLPLAAFGEALPKAMLAAEDGRFYDHRGIDPLALARSAKGALLHGRFSSGGSTLSQQLARKLMRAPRTPAAKFRVMAAALSLERAYGKDAILEAYLNEIEFGPNIQGADAASVRYFDKPARELSVAEAAALASLPLGPARLDPTRHADRLIERRNRVLDRMIQYGWLSPAEGAAAKVEPFVLDVRALSESAPHFARAVAQGTVDPCRPTAPLDPGAVEVQTTVLAELEADITRAAQKTVEGLVAENVTGAAVLVVDHRTLEILAYVGSPDFDNEASSGQIDGVRTQRQPGSTLKPFIYEAAFEERHATPATLLEDVPTSFSTLGGDPFRPSNYDHHFRGPVRAREALGNSLNVPAVMMLERVGESAMLDRLRALGFCSLSASPDVYGPGLALGNGAVTLFELVSAYSVLARHGSQGSLRAIRKVVLADGTEEVPPDSPPTQRLVPAKVALITDILADRRARAASFGEVTVFDLPFAVAAKTGTSKGFRDNFAIGYSKDLTVGVWVGNFDASPMEGVSGISGAGPLFREVMLLAARGQDEAPFPPPSEAESVEICPLSGARRGPDCPHGAPEWFARGERPAICTMHRKIWVDRATGEEVGERCENARAMTVEEYPPSLQRWAEETRRPMRPAARSSTCPPAEAPPTYGLSITFPEPRARFILEADGRSQIVPRATFRGSSGSYVIDGRRVAQAGAVIALSPGRHELFAEDGEVKSDVVEFFVDP